jgi:ribosomal protein L16 Arg81 hydroxylase
MTAANAAANARALAPLHADLGRLDNLLARPRDGEPQGMMWIGAAGSFTPLHHDLTNNLIAQVVGRKRVRLLPASEVGRLYNDRGVYSAIKDLGDPSLDAARFGRLEGVRIYDVVLLPGDILFVPLAWWHQVDALEFSVTVTYTDFLWPNVAAADYPAEPG